MRDGHAVGLLALRVLVVNNNVLSVNETCVLKSVNKALIVFVQGGVLNQLDYTDLNFFVFLLARREQSQRGNRGRKNDDFFHIIFLTFIKKVKYILMNLRKEF